MNITPYTRVRILTPTRRSHISELESLALRPKRINKLNDNFEMENQVNNIKQHTRITNQHTMFVMSNIVPSCQHRYIVGN